MKKKKLKLDDDFPILEFLNQSEYSEGFITGPGGSGKTEQLINIVEILEKHKINYLVVAYTNKAVDVIKNRVPSANVSTLHSWLKKRPGINQKAKSIHSLVISQQYGSPEPLQLLIIDEFSMVSEDDYFSIGELVDPEMNGDVHLHSLYIGDLSQLSPIKGVCPITPYSPFWLELTKVHRNTNELQKPLSNLRKMISAIEDGEKPNKVIKPLEANNDFIRGVNILDLYRKHKTESKILLAYTNEKVEYYNKVLAGKEKPEAGDIVFNSTMKQQQTVIRVVPKEEVSNSKNILIKLPGIGYIGWDTKYNPLKTLVNQPYINFYEVECLDSVYIIAGIFGSYVNKKVRESLGNTLVELNKQEKDSTNAYKLYKTINDTTHSLDFNYCMTTHKTQGSEWDYVFIDSEDYSKCINIKEQLKLLYVGISRARERCYMNT